MEFAERKKKKATPAKPTRRTKKAPPPSPEDVYHQLIDGMDLETAVPYSAKQPLEEGDLISHPTFGLGIVTSLTDVQKAKIFFETGERIMVCNRQ